MVKDWPVNEAYEQFIRSLLVLKEVHGDEEATRILQQAVTHEVVIGRIRAAQKQALLAPPAAATNTREIELAAQTLMFYGDPTNYERPARGKPSAVVEDGGFRARETLATLGGAADDGN